MLSYRRRILVGIGGLVLLGTSGLGIARADQPTADNLESHPALYGLCTAYFANGGNGNSHNAPPFQALEGAAGGADEVADFCAGVRPSNGQGGGAGNSNAPSPTEARGNNRP